MARATEHAPDDAAVTPYRRRLGEAAGSLGRPLVEIANENVVVTGLSFDNRPVKDKKSGELKNMDCAIITVESSDPRGTRYFVFGAVVEKLRAVDVSELPMDAIFSKIDIGNGQTTWNIE